MPGIAHEAPIELLRHNPLLAAALLDGSDVAIPESGTAVMVAGERELGAARRAAR